MRLRRSRAPRTDTRSHRGLGKARFKIFPQRLLTGASFAARDENAQALSFFDKNPRRKARRVLGQYFLRTRKLSFLQGRVGGRKQEHFRFERVRAFVDRCVDG